jgi:putative endonuclease
VKRKRPPASQQRSSTRAIGRRAERRAVWHYRLRGFRILDTNAWIAGYELDIVARRGSLVVFCEVKAKSSGDLGDPLEMVGAEKVRRMRAAAEGWLASNSLVSSCEARFDVATERAGKLTVLVDAF